MPEFTHLDSSGAAHMVDVTERAVTERAATARGRVLLQPATVALIRDAAVPKGDVIATARLAGIMAAKRTSELIPLCHPIALTHVDVRCTVEDWGIAISADARIADRTGIEMEALTAVSVAGLTIIDMVKAVDPAASLTDIAVATKSGGRSGDWRNPNG